MDRLCAPSPRRLVGVLSVSMMTAMLGCRATKSEVPPGKPYARTAEEQPVVGFSSDPHPVPGNASSALFNLGPGGSMDDRLAGGKSKQPTFGTPTVGEKMNRPTTNSYGPPGTAGLDPTAGPAPGAIADELMNTGESTAKSLTRDLKVNPPTGDQ